MAIACMMGLGACKRDIEKLIDCNESSLYQKAGFAVGVAVSAEKLDLIPEYRKIVMSQFNQITPEYAMKADFIHPHENQFNWADADRLIKFCEDNGKQLHGHTLVWHRQMPQWMLNYQGDWKEMMKHHIQTIVSRYHGRIKAWDVVNEAFNDDGTLRDTPWRKNIGENYIELAFQYVHEADPNAFLFYNDHDLEFKEKKRHAIINMMRDFKQNNIPVHGIGLQMHISVQYPTDRQIKNTIECFKGLGLKIHLSELDIAINQNGKVNMPTYQLLKEQKKKIKSIISIFRKLPVGQQYAVTLWGVSDADSWMFRNYNKDWPLLYDEEYKIKPSYCGFLEGLEGK
jgi:endo-1,4-beta-xylanase